MSPRILASLVLAGAVVVPSAALAASPSPSAPASSTGPAPARPPCPNPHGGQCLGLLDEGTYTTVTFRTPITYQVPEGWSNLEDLPGNFLLMPPGSSLALGDAGLADYIGVYEGVAIAQRDCQSSREPGVGTTAVEMAAALAERDGLLVTEPVPVEIGGLSGVMIDIALDGSGMGCAVDDFPGTIVPLIIGNWPASLEHAQIDGIGTRLYLLDHGDSNIVIEVSDTQAPGTTADYARVVEALAFALD